MTLQAPCRIGHERASRSRRLHAVAEMTPRYRPRRRRHLHQGAQPQLHPGVSGEGSRGQETLVEASAVDSSGRADGVSDNQEVEERVDVLDNLTPQRKRPRSR